MYGIMCSLFKNLKYKLLYFMACFYHETWLTLCLNLIEPITAT